MNDLTAYLKNITIAILIIFVLADSTQAGEVHLHGYGELHFNAPTNADNELDLHRFVLGLSYTFDDQWSFDMEIDFEHAFEEPEFEFLHLDYAYREELNFRGGLLLMPVGQLNQSHEPNLFFSVERPYTEKNIIPTSWQEPGIGVFGQVGNGIDYQGYLVAGMKADGDDGSKGIRGWRSKGIESSANEVAFVGRLSWSQPGLQVGASLFHGGVDQGRDLDFNSDLTLWALDFHWTQSGFDLRGTYASSSVSNPEDLNAYLGLEGDKSVGDQLGYYVTAGYDLFNGKKQRLMPFVTLEHFDTQENVPTGFLNKEATEQDVVTVGLAYFPIPRLALKVDYEQWQDGADGERSQFNAGFGFQY